MCSAIGMLRGFSPSQPLGPCTWGSTQSAASHRNRQTPQAWSGFRLGVWCLAEAGTDSCYRALRCPKQ